MTSELVIAYNAGLHGPGAWNGDQLFQRSITYSDTINVLTGDVARTAASGTVAIATTGVATFSDDQTGIIAAGDYITVGGVKYTIVSGATTSWTVTPPPSTAIPGGTAYIPYNAGSYVDLLPFTMPGIHPIPEAFRMRFGGTGTLNATYQFRRVNALTGVETNITTAVATTAAAVWTGVAAVATEQLAYGSSLLMNNGAASQYPIDERIRLVLTARTTTTTGRTLLLELGHRKDEGGNCYSHRP